MPWSHALCGRTTKMLLYFSLGFFSIAWFLFPGQRRGLLTQFHDAKSVVEGMVYPGSKNWAQYSPYYAVESYSKPPPACRIVQVNILQRHGSRFPTKGAGADMEETVRKLKEHAALLKSKLEFLKNFTYTMGTDDLIRFGGKESHESGKLAFRRYGHLLSNANQPFVRAAGSTRVILSAQNWTSGFAGMSNDVYAPNVDLIIPEDRWINSTLDHHMCPSAKKSLTESNIWLSIFTPPIIARLNGLAPGSNLDGKDVLSLMTLCSFDSVVTESLSDFCRLFSDDEFGSYEYLNDLNKYYYTGYGNTLGRVQGVGYVNELLARLTNSPPIDHTQTNRTLNSSPLTFPLNRTIYADFSHDNQMVAIYSAMGLFKQDKHLKAKPPVRIVTSDGGIKLDRAEKDWILSRMVPFAGRMVVEKLVCTREMAGGQEFVRILVDDAVQPLSNCEGSGVLGAGICSLKSFVESQAYARNQGEGEFEKCFQ